MERRLRVFILILLTAVLCLTAALVASTPQETTPASPTLPAAQATAVTVFSQDGLFGLRTDSGRVLLEPTWSSLRLMSDTLLVARAHNRGSAALGVIDYNGKAVVPFLYSSFEKKGDADLWLARMDTPDEKTIYHLYRGDGTRWEDTAWDACSYAGGLLTLSVGDDTYTATLGAQALQYESWHSVDAVGLHTLTMDWTAAMLRHAPAPDTLRRLSDAAAVYLNYLFITQEAGLDATLIGADDPTLLTVSANYRGCRLRAASISRVQAHTDTGLPSYTLQIQVRYDRTTTPPTETDTDSVETGMLLTVSRSVSGAYVYSAFFDPQYALTAQASTQPPA